ncbi:hypothetical protein CRG98_011668, partial [Punica granatum]
MTKPNKNPNPRGPEPEIRLHWPINLLNLSPGMISVVKEKPRFLAGMFQRGSALSWVLQPLLFPTLARNVNPPALLP